MSAIDKNKKPFTKLSNDIKDTRKTCEDLGLSQHTTSQLVKATYDIGVLNTVSKILELDNGK